MNMYLTLDGKCPLCGHILNAASGFELPPVEGDVTICINCLGTLVFNKDLSVKVADEDFLASLSQEDLSNILEMENIIQKVKDSKSSTLPLLGDQTMPSRSLDPQPYILPYQIRTPRGVFLEGTPLKIIGVDSFKGIVYSTEAGSIIFQSEITL